MTKDIEPTSKNTTEQALKPENDQSVLDFQSLDESGEAGEVQARGCISLISVFTIDI